MIWKPQNFLSRTLVFIFIVAMSKDFKAHFKGRKQFPSNLFVTSKKRNHESKNLKYLKLVNWWIHGFVGFLCHEQVKREFRLLFYNQQHRIYSLFSLVAHRFGHVEYLLLFSTGRSSWKKIKTNIQRVQID